MFRNRKLVNKRNKRNKGWLRQTETTEGTDEEIVDQVATDADATAVVAPNQAQQDAVRTRK